MVSERSIPPPPNSGGRRITFSREEIELLVRACKTLRGRIPAYLQSSQPELNAIDEVIRKLTADQGQ